MTEKAYYNSDALEMDSQILSCTLQEDGRWRVILSATLFHPQGGGQPSDTGTLGSATLLQAVHEGDTVIHFTDAPVAAGPVHIAVDAGRRRLHSRYHSAGHIIGVAGEKYGWQGNKGNHRPGESRVVFEATGQPRPFTVEDIAAEVAEMVARGLPRVVNEVDGRRRVTWGDLPPYACGGTHVNNTRDIGEIRIIKIREKKGQLSVQYELDE